MTPEQRATLQELIEANTSTWTNDLEGYASSGITQYSIDTDPVIDYVEDLLAAKDKDPSLFQRVMEASKTFVERFPGGKLTFHGAARKMQEEYFEYQHAVGDYAAAKTDDTLPSEHFNSYQELRKEAAREMIDLLVTVGGLGATIGLTWNDIEAAARETLDKLDSRTTDDYAWDDNSKTVMKKSKMQSHDTD
jgi:hypothetical protein